MSRLLAKLELHRYIVRRREGTDKIVSLLKREYYVFNSESGRAVLAQHGTPASELVAFSVRVQTSRVLATPSAGL